MSQDDVLQIVAQHRVVPVVAIDSAEAAIPLADALLDGGLPLVEITFRTPAAAEAIEILSRERPELLVGAGTVLTRENLRAAQSSGAKFAVAPGLNPDIVRYAKEIGLPFVPGVCTPSEIEQAISMQRTLLKFFPAETSGGVDALKALAAPYAHLGLRFMPTGGVNTKNLPAYLALSAVAAVGGSWLAKQQDLTEGRWTDIRDRCIETVRIVAKCES